MNVVPPGECHVLRAEPFRIPGIFMADVREKCRLPGQVASGERFVRAMGIFSGKTVGKCREMSIFTQNLPIV